MSDRIRAKVTRVRVDKHSATLASAAAVGATQLLVKDGGDLAGDGVETGTLLVNDDSAALLDFTDVTFVEDADPGDLTSPDIVTLANPLATAINANTELFVWETPDDGDSDGVVAEVIARCIPEDDEDASETGDPIRAVVPPELQDDLPPGRSDVRVVLEYDDDADEWVVVRLRGRNKGLRFEADDSYVITAGDMTAGTATIPLSHRPVDESVKLWWRTVAQEPTEYTVDASAQTISLPLGSFVAAGDRVWVHYAYRAGLRPQRLSIPLGSSWRYANGLVEMTETPPASATGAATYADPAFDDSAWATGPSGFGASYLSEPLPSGVSTDVGTQMSVWSRVVGTSLGGDLRFTISSDNRAWLYLDGVLIWSATGAVSNDTVVVAAAAGPHVVAAYGWDYACSTTGNHSELSVAVEEV